MSGLLGMHALTGCDTSSYPYGKGEIGAIKTLLEGDFPGLADGLGDVGATEAELLEAAALFLLALYGQLPRTSIESARYKLFTKKKKSPKIMTLPATTPNIFDQLSM